MFKLVDQYDAMTDTTVVLNYIKLDKKYPNSKFILTTRNVDEWLTSCKWFFSKERSPKLSQQQIYIREILYGAKYFNEKIYKESYINHHDKVYQYFKDREDLLVMNIFKGDGYVMLCRFLDKPIISEAMPK